MLFNGAHPIPHYPLIKIYVESINGVFAAERAGADRVELCASLMEGGLTPSYGTILTALERAGIPVFPIIRPRGGDFLNFDLEALPVART